MRITEEELEEGLRQFRSRYDNWRHAREREQNAVIRESEAATEMIRAEERLDAGRDQVLKPDPAQRRRGVGHSME